MPANGDTADKRFGNFNQFFSPPFESFSNPANGVLARATGVKPMGFGSEMPTKLALMIGKIVDRLHRIREEREEMRLPQACGWHMRMDQYDDKTSELEVLGVAAATAVSLVLLLVEATQYDRTPSVNRREHMNANLCWLYDESDIIYHNMLQMNKACFISFYGRLRGKGLRASKHLDVEEQVAIFLLIVGHDTRFRHAQASTMRSLETISKYFHVVLKYVLRLGKDLIKHATPDLPLATRNNHHVWANTYFKNCVGVVDGTFIPTTVPLKDQPRTDGYVLYGFYKGRGDCLFAVFIEKERHVQRGVALEDEEAPPVVEVEESEDVEDQGGMAVRDVYCWIFCLVLACVGVIFHHILLDGRLHEYVVDIQKFLEEETKRKEVKQEQGQGQARHLYMIEI
ncbi:hypothetical protein GIB67_011297 [Kingdonia uniflora]|uniref:DUF8040 domain-containing protein n=1 Tax=Kingdonia uniflora TaxID=39325 RepID=A0A7J7MNN3_9MAGN|nr:hypothetical protein GIB67_011297 [Kingdonia uniflora]